MKRKGFTLIEVLIVVAIVGILASVVLVGLGPIQRRGRDARRISDLRQAQTALELYYNKNGNYPASASWSSLTATLKAAGIGISNIPNDPSTGKNYVYGSDSSSYVVGATMEDATNPVLNEDIDGTKFGINCDEPVYCVEL